MGSQTTVLSANFTENMVWFVFKDKGLIRSQKMVFLAHHSAHGSVSKHDTEFRVKFHALLLKGLLVLSLYFTAT